MPKNPVKTKWNPNFDDKPTTDIPRIRFSQKYNTKCLAKGNFILEIGCGIGSYTHLIDRTGCIGLDLDYTFIAANKNK